MSSLFGLDVSYEEKKFYNIDTWKELYLCKFKTKVKMTGSNKHIS